MSDDKYRGLSHSFTMSDEKYRDQSHNIYDVRWLIQGPKSQLLQCQRINTGAKITIFTMLDDFKINYAPYMNVTRNIGTSKPWIKTTGAPVL